MMKQIRKSGKQILAVVLFLSMMGSVRSQDRLMDILKKELQREMNGFEKAPVPPYLISFRVEQTKRYLINTTFGTLVESSFSDRKVFTPSFRLGSYDFDNYHPESMRMMPYMASVTLPLEDQENALRQIIWNASVKCYESNLTAFNMTKAAKSNEVAPDEKLTDFVKSEPDTYYEKPLEGPETQMDVKKWEEKLKGYSKIFLKDKHIISGQANISFEIVRKNYLDTEGSATAENRTGARIMITGSVKADDGMELPLYLSYFAFTLNGLPDDKVIEADVQKMADKLVKLSTAPVVEPYSGPAILLGNASGVFFHEIFGHRIEALRMRTKSDSKTFMDKVGENVLPAGFSVIMDPTLTTYKGFALNGHYMVDDQGVRAEKVNVVEDGKLKNFLMTRTPVKGFQKSNGHARAEAGRDPTSRQSNMIVESTNLKSDEELRKMLIAEVKAQNKQYGYIIASVTNGFTITTTNMPNAFNVTPVEVYRVYVDGRPDELVRGVDLVGTPLAMFSHIECAGGQREIFTGFCGADSGSIPVSSVSPSVLVSQVEMQRKPAALNRTSVLDRPVVSASSNN